MMERILSRATEDVYVELRLDPVAHPPRAESVLDLLIARGLAAEPQEAVYVVAIDPEQVRRVACVARGDFDRVAVSIPAVLAVPILSGSSQIVLAHNHPAGRVDPSDLDYDLTTTIVEAANLSGITLIDHLIVAPDGSHFSFAGAGALEVPTPRRLEVQA